MPQNKTQSINDGPILSGLAAELKRAIERSGLSHSELHALTGISRTVIIGYANGRRKPGARELRLLCDALKITPNRLLYGTEKPFHSEQNPLRQFGITSDALAAVRLALILQMLPGDEQTALLTLVHGLLEARYGKQKFQEAIEALKIIEKLAGPMLKKLNIESVVEAELTPDRVEELKREIGSVASKKSSKK